MTWLNNPSEEPQDNPKPVPPTYDEVRRVDLGTEGDPRPIFLNAILASEEAEQYVQLLKEYLGIIAWSYAEMPGLDPKIAVHRLNIKPDAKSIKQAQESYPSSPFYPPVGYLGEAPYQGCA